MSRVLPLLLLVLFVAGTSSSTPAMLTATSFQITSTTDAKDASPGDGICQGVGLAPGTCTLRAAVQEANADPGPETILLPGGSILKPAVYTLTGASGEEQAASGDLDVSDALTVAAVPGPKRVARPVIDGGGVDRVFDVKSNGSLTLTGVTVRNGAISQSVGGAIYATGDLVLSNDTITGNSAEFGGGLRSDKSLVANNTTFSNNTAAIGGAIEVHGTLLLTRVLVTRNTSATGIMFNTSAGTISDSTFDHNAGAAILNSSGGLTVANSTVASNTGSGLSNGIGSTVTVTNSTIVGNSTSGRGGGLENGGQATLVNDTFAGNGAPTGGNVETGGSGSPATSVANTIFSGATSGGNCAGPLISKGHNLDDGTSCALTGPGDLSNQPPQLAALADNGGPTLTQALLPGSPAIDAGDAGSCPKSDQRGITRPTGNGCDIGAYEFAVSADLALTLSGAPRQVKLGQPVTYTASVLNKGPSAASGLDLTEVLPAGASLLSARTTSGSCTNGAAVRCSLGGLADQGKATVTIVVVPGSAGVARELASVKALQVDPDPTTNSARLDTTVVGPQTSAGGTSGFSAKLASLHGRRVHGRAHVSVVLLLSAKVKARLTLAVRGRRVAAKTVSLQGGRRTIKLAARRRSRAGRYLLRVAFSDANGHKSTLSARVVIR